VISNNMLWCVFIGHLKQHALEHNSNAVLWQAA